MEVLRIENLSIGYKRHPLIEDINLRLYSGEITAVIGRNGAGKSTLIKTLTHHLKPITGTVFIKNKPLGEYTKKELSKEISLVSTDRANYGGLKLEEMVSMGRIPYTGKLGLPHQEDKRLVNYFMNEVGIFHKKGNFIFELSDGERQKGMLARALVQQTPIVIMDEPFSFLDVASRIECLLLMRKIAREQHRAMLFSTHEVIEALKYSDKVWMFINIDGKEHIVAGTPNELIEKGYVDKIFPDSYLKFDRKNIDFIL